MRARSAARAVCAHSARRHPFASRIMSRKASIPRTITWFELANATKLSNSSRLMLRTSRLQFRHHRRR
jgi:hypothetical protein